MPTAMRSPLAVATGRPAARPALSVRRRPSVLPVAPRIAPLRAPTRRAAGDDDLASLLADVESSLKDLDEDALELELEEEEEGGEEDAEEEAPAPRARPAVAAAVAAPVSTAAADDLDLDLGDVDMEDDDVDAAAEAEFLAEMRELGGGR